VEKPDRPAGTSRPHNNDPIRTALTQPRTLRRWIEAQADAVADCAALPDMYREAEGVMRSGRQQMHLVPDLD
jgi:hypothetical protein